MAVTNHRKEIWQNAPLCSALIHELHIMITTDLDIGMYILHLPMIEQLL